MALRWSTAAGRLLLTATLLGVGFAQGSGSHSHTEQMPLVEVLGSVEALGTVTVQVASATPIRSSVAAGPASATPIPSPVAPTLLAVAAMPILERDDADLAALTLSRISYPWRTHLSGWKIVFLDARPSLRGVTLPATKRIEIYVRSSDTAESLARVVAHELGHAADVTLNDALDRSRWRAARGVESTVPWWPDAASTDFATMAGDFAEAFAAWQTGVVSLSTVAGAPTDAQLLVLASLVS